MASRECKCLTGHGGGGRLPMGDCPEHGKGEAKMDSRECNASMTICAKCRWVEMFSVLYLDGRAVGTHESGLLGGDAKCLCSHPSFIGISHITGKPRTKPHCHTINTGNCPKFEEKPNG